MGHVRSECIVPRNITIVVVMLLFLLSTVAILTLFDNKKLFLQISNENLETRDPFHSVTSRPSTLVSNVNFSAKNGGTIHSIRVFSKKIIRLSCFRTGNSNKYGRR